LIYILVYRFYYKRMSKANKILESILGVEQFEKKPDGIRGILQTKNYEDFTILSDAGIKLIEFSGAKIANKCLPGDHVCWNGEKCMLELRDEYHPIVGTIQLTHSSKFGLTSRGVPMYLFTPYNKCFPHFIVGCSEKDISSNKIGLIKFDKWDGTFPRGVLEQIIGTSGDYTSEKQALIWLSSPWKYPKGTYKPETTENYERMKLTGYTFNIDPIGCKDIDDVLTFEQLSQDIWLITITISDVARYVENGSIIDIYASLIGQTLYDSDGKIQRPMLPKEYSEERCSLLPGKKSHGVSLQFKWNGIEISDKVWIETEFVCDKSYSYEEFQESNSKYKPILCALANYLAKDNLEDSHKWIEQCMVFYNKEVGKILKDMSMGVLRTHSEPDIDKFEKYKNYESCGVDIKQLAISSAEYCLADEPNTTHFGLNTDTYAHATSPIRRYADLINQRILKIYISKSTEKYIVPISMHDLNYRVKLNRQYEYGLSFLNAISTGEKQFKGIILDLVIVKDDRMKVRIYIPMWKKTISVIYKMIDSNTILSRDESCIINVIEGNEVEIECTFNVNAFHWKDRVIVNIL